jgi:S1-C subfamily serine protease
MLGAMASPEMPPRADAGDSSLVTKVLAVLLLAGGGGAGVHGGQAAPGGGQGEIVAYEPRAGDDAGRRPRRRREERPSRCSTMVSPSVVHITNLAQPCATVITAAAARRACRRAPAPASCGTTAGHIVTNFHVVQNGDHLDRGHARRTAAPTSGKIVGSARDKDVAVIKIDAPPSKLRQDHAVGTSGDLQVGQKVLAIGNPFGLDQTLTTGVISGLGREIQSVDQPAQDLTTSSRPTRRSTPATPAGRCSTGRGG